jgi:hypothetical protein
MAESHAQQASITIPESEPVQERESEAAQIMHEAQQHYEREQDLGQGIE